MSKQNLGMVSQLGNLIFARTFRFTIDSLNNDKLVHFVVKASNNLKKKTLTIVANECVYIDDLSQNPIMEYLQSMLGGRTDDFVLKTYDGTGHTLTEHTLSNATLVDHHSSFDYASSDTVMHTMTFAYEESKTNHVAHLPSEPIQMGSFKSQKSSSGKTK